MSFCSFAFSGTNAPARANFTAIFDLNSTRPITALNCSEPVERLPSSVLGDESLSRSVSAFFGRPRRQGEQVGASLDGKSVGNDPFDSAEPIQRLPSSVWAMNGNVLSEKRTLTTRSNQPPSTEENDLAYSEPDPVSRLPSRSLRTCKLGKIFPWRRPWSLDRNARCPRQRRQQESYRGINPLLLQVAAMRHGFRSKWWATWNQWKALGGSVMRRPDDVPPGKWGTTIVFWSRITKTKTDDDEEQSYFLLKCYTVFLHRSSGS